jgi:hypothetical protein
MNAEDCPVHRDLIDRAEARGIFYPWICECPYPESVEDFHNVDGVLYFCYSDDHYCLYGGK